MYARTFNGTTDEIFFTTDLEIDLTARDYTFFFLGRKTDTGSWGSLFQGVGSSTERWTWEIGDDDQMHFSTDGGVTGCTSPWTYDQSIWEIWALSKSLGTNLPRTHKYNFTTGVWTHADATGSAQANIGAVATSCSVGVWSGSDHFTGQILCSAIFGSALSDTEIEVIPTLSEARFVSFPTLLWASILDQPSIGNPVIPFGSDMYQSGRTGTTVFDGPIPWPAIPNEPAQRQSMSAR